VRIATLEFLQLFRVTKIPVTGLTVQRVVRQAKPVLVLTRGHVVHEAYIRIEIQLAQPAELWTLRILAAALSPQLTLLGCYVLAFFDQIDRTRRVSQPGFVTMTVRSWRGST
jgi:hypothetical protein